MTDSVNAMASNLTSQVRNIAEVTTAVAKGDLSRKITGDCRDNADVLKVRAEDDILVLQLRGRAVDPRDDIARMHRRDLPGVAAWMPVSSHKPTLASSIPPRGGTHSPQSRGAIAYVNVRMRNVRHQL